LKQRKSPFRGFFYRLRRTRFAVRATVLLVIFGAFRFLVAIITYAYVVDDELLPSLGFLHDMP